MGEILALASALSFGISSVKLGRPDCSAWRTAFSVLGNRAEGKEG